MTIWRKLLQFINVMFANRSSMIVAERGSGRMTYATEKNPFAAQDLRVTLQRAGNYPFSVHKMLISQPDHTKKKTKIEFSKGASW